MGMDFENVVLSARSRHKNHVLYVSFSMKCPGRTLDHEASKSMVRRAIMRREKTRIRIIHA